MQPIMSARWFAVPGNTAHFPPIVCWPRVVNASTASETRRVLACQSFLAAPLARSTGCR